MAQLAQQPIHTLSVVALFYNEEASVEQVIREAHAVLRGIGEDFEIVAIQNGSTDRTPEILSRLCTELPELRVLAIPVNRGAGYGAVRGWRDARARYVIGVSGDGQVDLQAIPRMYELMLATGADLAYGRRTSRPDGRKRAVISFAYNLLVRLLFGIRSQDMNGLPKILTERALSGMQLQSEDHFLECEMMLKAQKMGLAMCSVDVEFRKRKGGRSSVNWKDCVDYLEHLACIRLGINDQWGMRDVPRLSRRARWVHCPNGVEDLAEIRTGQAVTANLPRA
ncbi:MAG TPA: glycosyltransferase family 2 protein [Bryobacteraceae bacterium]|nr:glycosyltransferase family 2 protein [Bryobacteraceae bacterium]